MSDTDFSLEDMISQLGGPEAQVTTGTEPETPPVVEPETPQTDPEVTPEGDANKDEPQQTQNPMDTLNADKTQQAFIHLRQTNKKYADTFKGIAQLIGVEATDEEAILAALQAKITEKEAQKNNVPLELYQKLQTLEDRDREYSAMQAQQRVAVGFESVRTAFDLSPDEVNQFATDLIQSGRNPLENPMDLVREYKLLYFDKLVEKKVNSAVAAEQERSSKANTQSTTPGDKTGGNVDHSESKVDSVRGLEQWFSAQTR